MQKRAAAKLTLGVHQILSKKRAKRWTQISWRKRFMLLAVYIGTRFLHLAVWISKGDIDT